MTNVPGLEPFEDDRPQPGGRLKEQRPIDTSGGIERMPRLRPVAQAVDLYARPAAPPQDNSLIRIADSLGQLNGALHRFGSVGQAAANRQAEADVRVAAMTRGPESLRRWEQQNPQTVRNIAGGAVLGEDYARRRAEQLQEEYNTTFDRANGDIEAWIREKTAADVQGRDAAFAGAYAQAMAPFISRLRQSHAQNRVSAQTQAIEGGLIGVYQNAIVEGKAAGHTPDQIIANIRARRDQDQRYLNITADRQDELMLQALREHGEKHGDRDLIEGILNAPRQRRNADGTTTDIGPLTGVPNYAPGVNQARDAAQRRDRERNQVTSVEELDQMRARADRGELSEDDTKRLDQMLERRIISREQNLSFRNQNRGVQERNRAIAERDRLRQGWREHYDDQVNQTIVGASEAVRTGRTGGLRERTITTLNERGEPQTERWTVQQQLEEASKRERARLEQLVRERQIDPLDGMNQLIAWYSQSGTINDAWKQALAGAYSSVNLSTLTQNNGKPSPQLMSGYELFRQIREKAPHVIDRHTTREARRFFEQVDASREFGQMSVEAAMQAAFAAQNSPAEQREQRRNDVDTAVRDLRQGGLAGFFGQSLRNPQDPYVISQIHEGARFFGQTLPPSEALAAAKKRFMETHRIVNGSAVNVNSLTIPPWFEDETLRYINFYADRDRTDGIERSDLALMRVGNSETFRLVHRNNPGIMIGDASDPTAMPSIFTLRHLEEFRERRRDQVNTEAANRAARRNDPLLTIGPISIGRPRLGGYDAGEMEQFNRGADEQRQEQQRRRDEDRQNPVRPDPSTLPPDLRPRAATPLAGQAQGDPMRPVNAVRDFLRSRRARPNDQ